MKNIFRISAIVVVLFAMASCNDDDSTSTPNPTTVTYKADLKGTSEVPPNASGASGMATLNYYTSSKTFNVIVTYTGMVGNDGHVHKGAVGVSGSPVFPFTSFTSPINFTSVALTDVQIADLNANLYYVNIHSAAYPNGEIRGQLIKQAPTDPGPDPNPDPY